MPIFRYFMFAGGALLALLFGLNLVLPQAAHVETVASTVPSADVPMIRIRSERKLPERVVLDTSQPTIVPPVKTAEAVAPKQAQTGQTEALSRVRDTFAQFTPEPKADAAAGKKAEAAAEAKPQVAQATPQSPPAPKHRAARTRSMQPQYYGPQYGYAPQYGYGYGLQYSRPVRVAQQPHYGLFGNTW